MPNRKTSKIHQFVNTNFNGEEIGFNFKIINGELERERGEDEETVRTFGMIDWQPWMQSTCNYDNLSVSAESQTVN